MFKHIIDSALEDLYSPKLNSELLDRPGLWYRNPTFHTITYFEKNSAFFEPVTYQHSLWQTQDVAHILAYASLLFVEVLELTESVS
jgi:hypothetical protein